MSEIFDVLTNDYISDHCVLITYSYDKESFDEVSEWVNSNLVSSAQNIIDIAYHSYWSGIIKKDYDTMGFLDQIVSLACCFRSIETVCYSKVAAPSPIKIQPLPKDLFIDIVRTDLLGRIKTLYDFLTSICLDNGEFVRTFYFDRLLRGCQPIEFVRFELQSLDEPWKLPIWTIFELIHVITQHDECRSWLLERHTGHIEKIYTSGINNNEGLSKIPYNFYLKMFLEIIHLLGSDPDYNEYINRRQEINKILFDTYVNKIVEGFKNINTA